MKRIDTSPMSAETATFNMLEDLLEALPARGTTTAEWIEIRGAFDRWSSTLAPGELAARAEDCPRLAAEVILTSGRRVRLSGEFRLDQLGQLLDALEGSRAC